MAVVRRDPARDLQSLISTFFDTPTTAVAGRAPARRWVPAMDLVDEGERYVLRADLPGLTEADVQLELDGDVLTLAGARQIERAQRGRIERASGRFRRTLRLPEGVDADAIAARFEHGVLEVTIPKPEERKPRRLEIQVGERPAAIEGESQAA